jgi:hypothetical protein
MPIRAATAADAEAWLALRAGLRPLTPGDEHRREIARQLADPRRFVALVENTASHDFHRAIGFTPTERVVFYRKELK